ncbi:hypothetical protein CS053_09475 [Rhodanobacter glycinis]|uniref:Uncharacterized protein n=1 Tax=Rhodanobacter glycinis TaxID=582702 RepID=A0A5B9E389_9GAMM|nr:hypothetical protein [Rhodanobacter glycinis]QEE24707.1 hypothetical protein CS053_09475 [Rhodanobacter glycinis]
MAYFTEWRRSMDGPELALVTIRTNGSIAEWITQDVRELPDRPELLERLGPVARERLLDDARTVQV